MSTRSTCKPIEVVLSAFNHHERLRAVLSGYLRQTETDFGIAVADDGSGPEVRSVIREFADHGLRIRHVWHEDRGFRKSRILNRTLAGSDAAYVILSDGDCIPSRHFVSDHLRNARTGFFLCGRRVDLGPQLSRRIVEGRWDPTRLDQPGRLLVQAAVGRVRRATVSLRPLRTLGRYLPEARRGLWGCNASAWMTDLLRINGFEGEFEGWGAEDVDLERRLRAAGLRSRALRGEAAVFHLHHPSRATSLNAALLAERSARGTVEARLGIREQLRESAELDAERGPA